MLGLIPLPWKIAAGLGLMLALTIGYLALQNHWIKLGGAEVTSAVEKATNDAIEKARKDKEAADEKARTDPPDVVIDRTR